jgi:glucokinase
VGRLCRIAAEFAADTPNPVIGVSCGDPIDSKRGLIQSPPNLPGWDDIPILEELKERVPGCRPHLMNDANAGALAEWRLGAGKGCQNLVFLTMGTGMGAGLILNGRLYEGTTGSAGEAGHIRIAPDGPVGYGKAGSFEGFCSGGGIAKLARAWAAGHDNQASFLSDKPEHITARDVGEAAESGNTDAIELLEFVGDKLGRGLAVIVDLLNPERIILGSIYVRCRKFLEPAMRKALEEEALSKPLGVCEIVPSRLGEEIGDHAALAVACYRADLWKD